MIITISTIIGTIVGIMFGGMVCALIFRSKTSALKTNLDNATRQIEETKAAAQADLMEADSRWEKHISDVKAEAQKHHEEAMAAKEKANADALETLKVHYDQSIKAQQDRFNETMSMIAAESKAATEEMLKARQKEFAETSSTNIRQIVNPLKDSIEKMETAMQQSSKEAVSMNSAMKENLDQMIAQSKAAQATTEELTRAFKHQSKVQGDWGETVLAELLASQGLTEGIQFSTQATIRNEKGEIVKSEEGSIMRPDVILHLDQKREVIIDSKVSLTAFFDYVNATTETDRKQYLKAHVESLQKHVKELSKKDYSSYIQYPKVKMDYVIMFVPHTGALWTALNEQPDLWRKAMEQNVFIADEQSLYAALKIIDMTWKQIRQAQNHEEVYRLASEMVDRVGQFVKKYEEVGAALDKAQKAYDGGKMKLEDHGQSIVLSANKLIKLGAKNGKNQIPEIIDLDEAGSMTMIEEEKAKCQDALQ